MACTTVYTHIGLLTSKGLAQRGEWRRRMEEEEVRNEWSQYGPRTVTASTPGMSTLDPSSPLLSSSSELHSDPGAPMTGSARRPIQEFPPRLWSSAAATKPLSGGVAQLKPDSVLVRCPADRATQTLEWIDVLMTAEVTSRKETLDLLAQIECKTLAMCDAQPN
jgi:hypothetical protein